MPDDRRRGMSHGDARPAARGPRGSAGARLSEAEVARREAELATWLAFEPAPAPIAPSAEDLARLESLGIALEQDEIDRLSRFLGCLFEMNERINLTRIERESAWSRHVVDSLTLLGPLAGIEELREAIDVGSGGGLPAIPLAIARADVQWTLLESTGKKARFLEAVARHLGLENVRVVHARAEQAARTDLRERFDVATSRAVGALGPLAILSVPFLRIGGLMLAIKGAKAPEEIAEAKQTLYALHAQVAGEVETGSNTIVAVEKTRKTPAKFP
ncbi:MAG: putative glucose-inhibited division protein [Planctomycetota bacterium]